jgi:hypothetical protein
MPERDGQTGEYAETYPLAAFRQALERLGEADTKRVEQAVGCQYRTAIAKLHELEDQGLATSRRVGNAYLWTLADTGDVRARDADREPDTPESPSEDTKDALDGSGPYDPTDDLSAE